MYIIHFKYYHSFVFYLFCYWHAIFKVILFCFYLRFCNAITFCFVFYVFMFFSFLLFSFSVIGTLYLTLFYFVFIFFFAMPIQFVLNIRYKRFNLVYLLVYIIVAFIATAIGFLQLGGNPMIMESYYIFSILSASLFWIFDSALLQKE